MAASLPPDPGPPPPPLLAPSRHPASDPSLPTAPTGRHGTPAQPASAMAVDATAMAPSDVIMTEVRPPAPSPTCDGAGPGAHATTVKPLNPEPAPVALPHAASGDAVTASAPASQDVMSLALNSADPDTPMTQVISQPPNQPELLCAVHTAGPLALPAHTTNPAGSPSQPSPAPPSALPPGQPSAAASPHPAPVPTFASVLALAAPPSASPPQGAFLFPSNASFAPGLLPSPPGVQPFQTRSSPRLTAPAS